MSTYQFHVVKTTKLATNTNPIAVFRLPFAVYRLPFAVCHSDQLAPRVDTCEVALLTEGENIRTEGMQICGIYSHAVWRSMNITLEQTKPVRGRREYSYRVTDSCWL